jgi:hypothetical protein
MTLLERLLKTAAAAPKEMPCAPPFALETRVLAHWRSAPAEEDFALLATVFQRAVICAGIILVASAGWTWFETRQQASGAMALANYTLTMGLKP